MKRTEKIELLIRMIADVEGVSLEPDYFDDYSDEWLEDELDWFDYLLTK